MEQHQPTPRWMRQHPLIKNDQGEVIYSEELVKADSTPYPHANVLREPRRIDWRRIMVWVVWPIFGWAVIIAATVACLHEAGCIGR